MEKTESLERPSAVVRWSNRRRDWSAPGVRRIAARSLADCASAAGAGRLTANTHNASHGHWITAMYSHPNGNRNMEQAGFTCRPLNGELKILPSRQIGWRAG